MPVSRVVIVGASMGGLRAAEALRRNGYLGELVVVGDEPHMPYNRPPLSKSALTDDQELDRLAFRMPRASAAIEFRLGSPVIRCDAEAKTLMLQDGSTLDWTGLVIASGLRPRRCAIPGPAAGRYVLRTVADAQALRCALRAGLSVAVIGAGFVGCEVAASVRQMGLDVTVVAPERVPLERPLGHDLGLALQRRHERHGVRFEMGVLPVGFGGDCRVGSVMLNNGGEIPADVVVEALGCQPNIEWLAGNAFDLSDGVLCDNLLRAVGHHAVVACGDVARFPNPRFDDVPRRVEHWTMVTDTAKRAGRSLADMLHERPADTTPFIPLPSFWSDQFDMRLQSFGAVGLGSESRILEGDPHGDCVVGYLRGGVLVGIVMVGHADRVQHYRNEVLRAGAGATDAEPFNHELAI